MVADLRRLSDMPSRRRLRSSFTDQLDVRQSQCSTIRDWAFAVAGARLWNSLPRDIVACDTLSRFRRELKTFLFIYMYDLLSLSGPCRLAVLADRTNGRAYATVWRLSVVCLFMAKRCVLEQKLQFTAYRKSYMKNRLVPKWMTLTFV